MNGLTVAQLILVLVLFTAQPARAYVDPGSGSMLLQLVLGGVAGLLVLMKVFWRRLLTAIGLAAREDAKGKSTPDAPQT
jgi:hypothetical protein